MTFIKPTSELPDVIAKITAEFEAVVGKDKFVTQREKERVAFLEALQDT